MGCNRSEREINFHPAWVEVDLYLSEVDIKKLNAAAGMGAGAAGFYAVLVEQGVLAGTLSNPLSAAIGSAIAFYLGWINWTNSGNGDCGVHMTTFVAPGSFTGTVVNSQ